MFQWPIALSWYVFKVQFQGFFYVTFFFLSYLSFVFSHLHCFCSSLHPQNELLSFQSQNEQTLFLRRILISWFRSVPRFSCRSELSSRGTESPFMCWCEVWGLFAGSIFSKAADRLQALLVSRSLSVPVPNPYHRITAIERDLKRSRSPTPCQTGIIEFTLYPQLLMFSRGL